MLGQVTEVCCFGEACLLAGCSEVAKGGSECPQASAEDWGTLSKIAQTLHLTTCTAAKATWHLTQAC